MNIDMLKSIWKLAKSYWDSEEKLWARFIIIVIVAMNLGMVYLQVQVTHWYNSFYSTMQAAEYSDFWMQVGRFTVLAFIYIVVAVYAFYLRQLLTIRWRTWMTNKYLNGWIGGQVYYKMKVLGTDLDNPDQRIATDIGSFISSTMTLGIELLNQVVTLFAFIFVLWELSGTLTVPLGGAELKIPGYMVFVSLIYSIGGTWLVQRVGSKLVKLNFENEKVEADFRFSMIRVRENAESIAFYKGEEQELTGFRDCFMAVIKNYRSLMRQYLGLNYFVNGFGQIAIIFPMVMAFPQLITGQMALGGFMETLSAFGNVQGAMSYFVDAYADIADYAAVTQRLTGFSKHMEEMQALEKKFKIREAAVGSAANETTANVTPGSDAQINAASADAASANASQAGIISSVGAANIANTGICVKHANVGLPDGRVLIRDLNFSLEKGGSLLVTGASGCGKSTLLRQLAGIWPFGDGEMELAADAKVLFLPQRPYLPLGSLKTAVFYPQAVEDGREEDLKNYMEYFGIGQLMEKLDEVDDWSRILSLGEQQRLAFIRILLYKPTIVFMDESTSALDAENEQLAFELLTRELPDTILISVGHRSALKKLHKMQLTVTGGGNWEIN